MEAVEVEDLEDGESLIEESEVKLEAGDSRRGMNQ
jgi:hypothetical protein